MATNYTTKTAALKATTADIRKVTAKTVDADEIKVVTEVDAEGNKTYSDVKTLIDEAQTAATEAAGITVKRDLNLDYDSEDEGEVLEGKIKGMNFYGEFVNVVDNGDGTINLYFGENKNPDDFSSITGISGDNSNRYVYTGDGYSTAGYTSNNSTTYKTTQKAGSEVVYATSNGTVINIPNTTSTVTVEALDGNGSTVIASATTAAIDAAGADETTGLGSDDVTATSVANTTSGAQAGALSVNVYDIIINRAMHAKEGLTPGFIRCKISATVDNAKLRPSGGSYTLRVKVGNKTSNTVGPLFIWKDNPNTPSVGNVTATYSASGTRNVSGIAYDTKAKCDVTVANIANTQYMTGTNLRRINIDDTCSQLANFGDISISGLTITSSSATANDVVYGYKGSKDFTSSSPTTSPVSGTITVKAYNSVTNTLAGTEVPADITGVGDNCLWTVADKTDDGAHAYFTNDGTRLPYTVLTKANGDVTGLTISTDTYNSSTSIEDDGDYEQQLLIQDSKLMHPKHDVTGKYTSNCTGTRYYVKKIVISSDATDRGGSNITVSAEGLTKLNNTDMKLWVVNANAKGTDAVGTKAIRIDANSANSGAGVSCSNGVLTFNIAGGDMLILNNSAFYLVVQMSANCTTKLGPITVA